MMDKLLAFFRLVMEAHPHPGEILNEAAQEWIEHFSARPPEGTAPSLVKCSRCNGTGDDFGSFACSECKGTGLAQAAPSPHSDEIGRLQIQIRYEKNLVAQWKEAYKDERSAHNETRRALRKVEFMQAQAAPTGAEQVREAAYKDFLDMEGWAHSRPIKTAFEGGFKAALSQPSPSNRAPEPIEARCPHCGEWCTDCKPGRAGLDAEMEEKRRPNPPGESDKCPECRQTFGHKMDCSRPNIKKGRGESDPKEAG